MAGNSKEFFFHGVINAHQTRLEYSTATAANAANEYVQGIYKIVFFFFCSETKLILILKAKNNTNVAITYLPRYYMSITIYTHGYY